MPSNRAPRPPNGEPNGTLDETNRRILRTLADNPRLSTAELARTVGMSAPAVRERVGRLERAGVIRGYRLDIDPAAIGLPVTAWVRIRPGPGQLPKIAELARRTPRVSECHRISGEDCFLLKVHVPTIEDLEGVLDAFLLFGQTTSSFVVSTPVEPRPVGI
ncbi:MAG: winged helix-turn-helix transcriptional regulator [Actinophytocola sp.]|uniref:Lrp/AsnC family transcriptional regulator n=1 Tax=Actinophytocola sp. TaxID=1872138 RepID=UPI001329179C|nr:Lrp/AsnC family transcriptional regulator [Actinophytocola sp.]MPZ85826.1 winged helix-turn-helix transcriptional regulator [Actinophytocola sp.]